MKRWNKKALPLLVGKQTGNTIKVWCPYCKLHHNHGWETNAADSDASHRVAHCDFDSPLFKSGYYISVEPNT